ncbi:PAS domain S-box protein [Catalinimonas sp. 4WD22]|uniref:PAS domain S-box protein n=1 Tax=Catalinimonas locisalis TaxID=3133978 RepID=UPI0031018D32
MKTLAQAIKKISELEAALEQSRQAFDQQNSQMAANLEELYEIAGVGWWTANLKTGYIEWSEEVYRQYDWPLEEPTPSVEDYFQLIHPDHQALVKKSFTEAYHNARLTFEKCILSRRQVVRYLRTTVKPLKNEKGEKVGLYGTTLDITEIRKAEEALRAEKEKYKLITESIQDLICMHQLDGTITYMSPSVKKVLGYAEDEMLGQSPAYFLHPEDVENVRQNFRSHAVKGEKRQDIESRIRRKDGKYLWFQTNITPVRAGKEIIAFQTVSRDITAQRLAQDQIKVSERNYRRLASNIPDTDIFLFDNDMRFIVADGATMQKLNQTSEQYEGKRLEEAVPENIKNYFRPIFEATLQGEFVHSNIMSEGEYFNHRTVPLRDDQGNIEGGLLVCQNISEQKRAEEALLKVKEELEEAQELAGIGSWELEIKTGKLSLSSLFKKLIGAEPDFSPDIHQGLNFFCRHSRQLFQRHVRKSMREGSSFDLELEMCIPGRERMWVRTLGKTLMRNQKPYKLKGVFQDISKAKKAELHQKRFQKGLKTLNLIASHSQLDFKTQIDKSLAEVAAFLGMPLGVISRIEEGYCHVSHSVRTASGLPDMQDMRMPLSHTYCSLAYRQNDVVAISCMKDSAYKDHAAYANIRMESYIGTPLRIDDKIYGIVNFMDSSARQQDFSEEDKEFVRLFARWVGSTLERIHKEEELIEAKRQAEHASMAKAQFLSTMSHEIRTPLNAVIGISHLLLQDDPKPEQLENLHALRFSGENLLALINDILDFSKIEAGKIEFEEVDFSLGQLLKGIQHSLAFKAEEKGVALRISQEEAIPETLTGDPTRLSQIMNNLVSNAIKFTQQGSVEVRVRIASQEEGKVKLTFEVEDSGIGIPEDKQSHIFDSFSQASSDTTRHYGGTGLGLAITKKLLELQGSQIQLNSREGEGSLFYFELEFKASSQRIEDKSVFLQGNQPFRSLEGYKVLLVEDNKMNVIVARQFLNKWKLAFEHAENGQEAVDRVIGGEQYDLILMDLQMPVLDGYEASLHIRKVFPALPIIALTASAMLEIQERVYKVGMNDFVTKPFNPNELYHKIVKQLPQKKDVKA